MKRNTVRFLFSFIIVFVLISGFTNNIDVKAHNQTPYIWLPRGFSPAFVTPGNTFSVEILEDSGILLDSCTAYLQNDLRSWEIGVEKIEEGKVKYGTNDGYIMTLRVPEGIPPELFALVIVDKHGNPLYSPRSVKVETDLEQDFYIFHITDEHVIPGDMIMEDGRNSNKTTSVSIKYWSQDVINIANPRLVVYTGDNTHTYNNASNWLGFQDAYENLTAYMNSMAGYTVATALVAGNHDIGWHDDYVNRLEWGRMWEDIIGARAFSVTMGSFYLLCSEYSLKDYFDWTLNEYNKNYTNPSIRFRLIASHFYEDSASFTPVANGENPCDLMIVGHNHSTKKLECPYYPVYSTTKAQSFNSTGFFEFKKTDDGWDCPQISNRKKDDVFTLWGNYGTLPKIRTTYERENNGTAESNVAYIVNDIAKNFYDGRIRFLMAKGIYNIEGGTILAQYDYDDNYTAVLVRVDIKPLSKTEVTISKHDEILE